MDLLPKNANHYDFSCRICLRQTLEMFSLFECRDSVIVYEEVMFCTNLTIQKGDNFPESICKECLGELNTAAQFKRKSEQSDTILKGFVQNFKHEIKIEYEPEIPDSNAPNSSYDELSDEDCKPLKSFLKTKKNNIHKSKVKKLQQNHTAFEKENQAITACEQTLSNVEENTDINISDDLDEECLNKSGDDVDIIEKEVKTRQKKYKKAIKPNKKKDKRTSSIADLTCETCNLKCQTKWALKVHMRTHSGERPFQCDICLKRYVSNSNMRTHKRLTHDEEKQVCAKCGKSFSCLTYLKRHQVTHLEVKPHACTHCPRRFSTRAYLREHAARHRGDRRFCCEACGASFVSDVNLKQHMVTHGVLKWDFKRHQCTFCEYRTTGRVALARHVRKHTGEKPFLCSHDGCQSAFAGKASLLLHIRIHTGEKPYSCSECPAKFSRSDKHKNHMLKKHNINSVGPNKRSRLIIQELVDRQQASLGPT